MKQNVKAVGSFDEWAELYDLQERMSDVGIMFTDLVNQRLDIRDDMWAHQKTIQELNQLFCQTISMQTLSALCNGVQPSSIFSILGLYIGCCYVNKRFGEIRSQHNAFADLANFKASESKAYKDRIVRVCNCENENRLPLTADAVAVICVGFCKQAYFLYHKSDILPEYVTNCYNSAIDALYEIACYDGVTEDDLNLAIQKFVGNWIEKDPEAIRYFDELVNGQITKGPGVIRSYEIEEDGQVRTECVRQWDGSFVDANGELVELMLRPRQKSSMLDLAKQHVTTLYNIFSNAATIGGFVDLLTSPQFQNANMAYCRMIEDDIGFYNPYVHSTQFSDDELSWFIDNGASIFYDNRDNSNSSKSIFERAFRRNPELLTACGKWLHIRPEAEPYYFKSRAEYFIKQSKDEANDSDMIEFYDLTASDCFAKYHRLLQFWQAVYIELFTLDLDIASDDTNDTKVRLDGFADVFDDVFEDSFETEYTL